MDIVPSEGFQRSFIIRMVTRAGIFVGVMVASVVVGILAEAEVPELWLGTAWVSLFILALSFTWRMTGSRIRRCRVVVEGNRLEVVDLRGRVVYDSIPVVAQIEQFSSAWNCWGVKIRPEKGRSPRSAMFPHEDPRHVWEIVYSMQSDG